MAFTFGQTGAAKPGDAGGGSFAFGTPKTTSTGTFSLAATSTVTTASTAAAPSLFGQVNTTSTTPAIASISTLTATTASKPGLGGAGYSNQSESSTNPNATAPVPVKQQMLPSDIHVLVTGLEAHIKKEKEESSEVAKYSQRQLNKIKENANSLELLIRALKSNVQRENSTVDKLCQTATQLQKNVEMAQRTHDTHAALQHENVLPSRYFAELIIEFEQKLAIYRSQIDQLESHLAASSDIALSELPQTLERLHQTFIALAAGLQIILTSMEKLKHRYLNYRRQVIGDTTDVFQKKKAKMGGVIKGPSPFAELSNLSVLAMAQFQSHQPQNQPPNTGFNTTGNTSLFGGNTAVNTANTFGNKPTGGFSLGNNTGGSLFGNTGGNTGGSLFGNTSTNANTTTGGLFGNNTANQQPKSAFSFGGNTSTTPAAGGSLFGNTNTNNSNNFGAFGKK